MLKEKNNLKSESLGHKANMLIILWVIKMPKFFRQYELNRGLFKVFKNSKNSLSKGSLKFYTSLVSVWLGLSQLICSDWEFTLFPVPLAWFPNLTKHTFDARPRQKEHFCILQILSNCCKAVMFNLQHRGWIHCTGSFYSAQGTPHGYRNSVADEQG